MDANLSTIQVYMTSRGEHSLLSSACGENKVRVRV